MKKMLWIKFAPVIPMLLGCVFWFCEPTKEEPLRWRVAMDIPVNLTDLTIDGLDIDSLDIAPDIGNALTYILDIGVHEVSIPQDVREYLDGFTDHELGYQIKITNRASISFTLHGLLFPIGDMVQNMSAAEFYEFLKKGPLKKGCVPLTDSNGLKAPSGGSGVGAMPDGQGKALYDLVFGSSKAAYMRWIAEISAGDSNNIAGEDAIDINLRINVSGVSGFETFFN